MSIGPIVEGSSFSDYDGLPLIGSYAARSSGERPKTQRPQGPSAIKNLKQAGITDFKLKAGVMLKKDDKGNVSLLETKDRHLLGTAVGTTTGALIGLLGGAARHGAWRSPWCNNRPWRGRGHGGIDTDFLDGVSRDLRPGMTAIIVEANESSTRTVDDIVARGGGHVYRQEAAEV